MRSFNKYILGLLLGGCIFASVAEENNTFTITITGPEEQTAQQAQAPARATPQRAQRAPQRQTRAAAAAPAPAPRAAAQAPERLTAAAVPPAVNQANTTNYTVRPQDTIWSIASRFTPVNSNVNEFQTIASIYRNNPDAFANGNINNLRQGTIKIPSVADIARESTEVGSQLLRNGSMTLPALAAVTAPVQAAPAAPAANGQDVTDAINQAVAAATGRAPAAPEKAESTVDNTKSSNFDIPLYVARETKLREMKASLDDPSKNFYNDDDGSVGDSEGITVNADNDPATAKIDRSQYKDAKPLAASDLDLVAVKTMLETTQQQFVKANEKLDQKIDQSVLRAESVAKSSASSIAKDEVVKALSHYEGVIANLQQSNAELRASISKFNKQVDQIRAISINNADKLSQLESQYIGITESGDDSIPQGPMMWILLGVGVLCLVLAISFFLLKGRKSSNDNNDDYSMDDDDLSSDMLITSSIVNKADLHAAEEEEYAAKAGLGKGDGSSAAKEAAEKEANAKKADMNRQAMKDTFDDQLIVPANFNGEDEMPPQEDDELSEQEREAQRAWEEAAKKKAEAAAVKKKQLTPSEDDVMAAWSASLSSGSDDTSTVVDVEKDDSSNKNVIREEDKEQSQESTSLPQQENEAQEQSLTEEQEEPVETIDTYNDPSTSIDDSDIQAVSDESQLKAPNTSEQELALANAWVSSLNDDSTDTNTKDKEVQTPAQQDLPKSNASGGSADDVKKSVREEEKAMADAWAASFGDNDTAVEIESPKSRFDSDLIKSDDAGDIFKNADTQTAVDEDDSLSDDFDLSYEPEPQTKEQTELAGSDLSIESEPEKTADDVVFKPSDTKSAASDEEQAMADAFAAAMNRSLEQQSLVDDADMSSDSRSDDIFDNSFEDTDKYESKADDEIVMSSLDDIDDNEHLDFSSGHDLSADADIPASAEEQELMEKMAKSMSAQTSDTQDDDYLKDDSAHSDSNIFDSQQALSQTDHFDMHDDMADNKQISIHDEPDASADEKNSDNSIFDLGTDESPSSAMSDEDIARALKQRSDELMYPQPKDNDSSIFDNTALTDTDHTGAQDLLDDSEFKADEKDYLSDMVHDDDKPSALDNVTEHESVDDEDELSLDDIVGGDHSIEDMHSSDIFADHDGHERAEPESVDEALAKLESNERSEDFGDLKKAFAADGDDDSNDMHEELPLDATSLQNSLNGTPDKVHVIGDDLDFGSLLNQEAEKLDNDSQRADLISENSENSDNDDEDDFDLEFEDDRDESKSNHADVSDTQTDNLVDSALETEADTDDDMLSLDDDLSKDSAKDSSGSDVSWEVPQSESDFDVTDHAATEDKDDFESYHRDPIEKAIDADRDMLESMLANEEIHRDPISGDEILSADGLSSRDIANMLKEHDDDELPDLSGRKMEALDTDSTDAFENTALSDHFDDDTGNIEHADTDNSTIDSRLHQKLTDELNLAQLFFETGDTDDALAIVDKVRKQGSPDLIQIAEDLKSRYADN